MRFNRKHESPKLDEAEAADQLYPKRQDSVPGSSSALLSVSPINAPVDLDFEFESLARIRAMQAALDGVKR